MKIISIKSKCNILRNNDKYLNFLYLMYSKVFQVTLSISCIQNDLYKVLL